MSDLLTSNQRVDPMVLAVCTAYESGFAHGLEGRATANPYAIGAKDTFDAWEYGHRQGTQRRGRDAAADVSNAQPELRQVWVNHIPFMLSPVVADEIERLRKQVETSPERQRLERVRARAHSLSAVTCAGCSDWTHPLCWIASELDSVLDRSAPETPAESVIDKLCERIKEMRRALYTYGTYGEAIGGPVLDGVLDVIDELSPPVKSTTEPQS